MSDETVLCAREGCTEMVVLGSVGRPKRFCSAACRKADSRAKVRAVRSTATYRAVLESFTGGDDLVVIRAADYARLVTTTERAFAGLHIRRAALDPRSVAHANGYRDACTDMETALSSIRSAVALLNVGAVVADDLN